MTSIPDPKSFSHLDAKGEARMVDVGAKPVQHRRASAEACFHCAASTIQLLRDEALPKGDVLAVARVAGIQAAKQTASLIPLCHPLPLTAISIDFTIDSDSITLRCSVQTDARTGVEMEALTGASIAALTLYDMCKSVDKELSIQGVRLVEKQKEDR